MRRPNHGVVGLSFLGARGLQSISLVICISLAAKFISSMVENQQVPPKAVVAILCVFCVATLYCAATLILYFDHQLPLIPSAIADVLLFIALMASSIAIGKPLSYLSCKAVTKGSTREFIDSLGSKIDQDPSNPATSLAAQEIPYAAPTPTYAATVVQYTTTTMSNAAATVAATLTPGGNTKVTGSDGNVYTISGRSVVPRDLIIKEDDYKSWITGGSMSECMMMKTVWGFGIAMTVMFVFSAVMLAFIWKSQRAGATKAVAKDAESE